MAGRIIIIDDNPADTKLLRLALTDEDPAIETIILEDGTLAIEYFHAAKRPGGPPAWDLVLMDLSLPVRSGFEVLAYLKSDPEWRSLPVVVLSGSTSAEDVDRCYTLGANSFISKPAGIDEVFAVASVIVNYWFRKVHLPTPGPARMIEEISHPKLI